MYWGQPQFEAPPAPIRKPAPKLVTLIFCDKCGCTYTNECPEHMPMPPEVDEPWPWVDQ